MTINVNIGEAKTRFSELCAAALRGEEVIVQNAGIPKLKLVPIGDEVYKRQAELVVKRVAAVGFARAKYAHLSPDAFDVSNAQSEADFEERFGRKFRAPAA